MMRERKKITAPGKVTEMVAEARIQSSQVGSVSDRSRNSLSIRDRRRNQVGGYCSLGAEKIKEYLCDHFYFLREI